MKIAAFLIVAGLVVTPLFGDKAWPLTGDLTHDPALVVEYYLRLDSKGVRLESVSHEVLYPYISWREEPLWGKVIIIKEYEVLEDIDDWQVISMSEALIPVEFQVVGTVYWETASYVADPQFERIWVRVKGFQDRWRMIGPQFPPHVGLKRMIYFVRHAIMQETDQSRIEKLKALRSELEKAE